MIRPALATLAAVIAIMAAWRGDWAVALYWFLIVDYWVMQIRRS